MLSVYDNLNIIERNIKVEDIKKNGAVIMDFNGAIYKKYEDNSKVVKCMIDLLNKGYRVIIDTNNRANEILSREKSLLRYEGKFFLDYVDKDKRKNFIVYADNRTAFYLYNTEQNIMKEQKEYKKGKDFYREGDKHEIKEKLLDLLEILKKDKELINLHPDNIMPECSVEEKDVQVRINMLLPDDYEFGNYVVAKIKETLKEYNIEVHVGRTGFYITRDGLDKSLAVQHAIKYFNLSPESIISIGDKFGLKADSDLYIAVNCNVLSINVGKESNLSLLKNSKPIVQIGGQMEGTLKVLSFILQREILINADEDEIDYKKIVNHVKSSHTGLIIGIEGPTGCGKTSLANELKEKFNSYGFNDVIVFQLDWFLRTRQDREEIIDNYLYNKFDIEEYKHYAWNYDKFVNYLKNISRFLKTGEVDEKYNIDIDNVYNRKNGLTDQNKKFIIDCRYIIIVEGTDILDKETKDCIDLAIKVDVESNDILLNRVLDREKQKDKKDRMPISFIVSRFFGLDLAHTMYVRSKDFNLYSYYINNSNFSHRKICHKYKAEKTSI